MEAKERQFFAGDLSQIASKSTGKRHEDLHIQSDLFHNPEEDYCKSIFTTIRASHQLYSRRPVRYLSVLLVFRAGSADLPRVLVKLHIPSEIKQNTTSALPMHPHLQDDSIHRVNSREIRISLAIHFLVRESIGKPGEGQVSESQRLFHSKSSYLGVSIS